MKTGERVCEPGPVAVDGGERFDRRGQGQRAGEIAQPEVGVGDQAHHVLVIELARADRSDGLARRRGQGVERHDTGAVEQEQRDDGTRLTVDVGNVTRNEC